MSYSLNHAGSWLSSSFTRHWTRPKSDKLHPRGQVHVYLASVSTQRVVFALPAHSLVIEWVTTPSAEEILETELSG